MWSWKFSPVTSVAFFSIGSFILWKLWKKLSRKPKGRGRRSLSFSSEVLLNGSFPDDTKSCQPIVNGLFYLEKCPSIEELAEKVEALVVLDRFRSGAKREGSNWVLVDLNQKLSIEKDVIVTLNFESEEDMKLKIHQLCVEEINVSADKPLWRVYRLINSGSGKCAMLARVHHVIGDGVALVSAMRFLFDNKDGTPLVMDIPGKIGGGSKFGFKFGILYKFIKSFFSILLLPHSKRDNDVAFCSDHSDQKKMGSNMKSLEFPVLKLSFVKEIKNRSNVTVNDVLMSITSGMIRRYSVLKSDGQIHSLTTKGTVQLRALLPVAFPRPKKDLQNPATALRNQWSLISAPLAVNEITPKDRLAKTANITRKLKKSPTAFIQLFLQNWILAYAPTFLTKKLAFDIFTRHSIVFSNLPGPSNEIKICGQTVLGVQIIFPNLIPQVIILSYNGGVFLNMCIDANSVDVDLLPKLFLEEAMDLATSLGINATSADMLHSY